MKKGDKIICKTECVGFRTGETYTVGLVCHEDKTVIIFKNGAAMFNLVNSNVSNYFYKYFITIKEYRKLKLQKLNKE